MHEGGARLPSSATLSCDFPCPMQVTCLERSPSSESHLGALGFFTPIARLQTPNPTSALSRAPAPTASFTDFA